MRDCVERNHISKIHFYDDHVFTVVHAPELGSGGHVHYVELDQFVGSNYLVTVHGPLNPAVDPEVAFVDTRLVLRRIEQDEIHPRTPMERRWRRNRERLSAARHRRRPAARGIPGC